MTTETTSTLSEGDGFLNSLQIGGIVVGSFIFPALGIIVAIVIAIVCNWEKIKCGKAKNTGKGGSSGAREANGRGSHHAPTENGGTEENDGRNENGVMGSNPIFEAHDDVPNLPDVPRKGRVDDDGGGPGNDVQPVEAGIFDGLSRGESLQLMGRIAKLLERYHLTEQDTRKQISNAHFGDISRKYCGRWRELYEFLDRMEEIDVTNALRDGFDQTEKKKLFLGTWKQKNGLNATYYGLIYAHMRIEDDEGAGQVCGLLARSLGKPNPQPAN